MQKRLIIFDTNKNKILLERWEGGNSDYGCSEKLMVEHVKKFMARSKKFNDNCIIISNFQTNI